MKSKLTPSPTHSDVEMSRPNETIKIVRFE